MHAARAATRRDRAARASELPGFVNVRSDLAAQQAAARRRHRPQPRRRPRRVGAGDRHRPCRSCSAGSTSRPSSSRARPTRSWCSSSAASAPARASCSSSTCAARTRTADPAGVGGARARVDGAARPAALRPPALGDALGELAAGRAARRVARADPRRSPRRCSGGATGYRVTFVGRVGGLLRVGERARLRLPAGDRHHLSGAGGAVRELLAPVHDPDRGRALLHRRARDAPCSPATR